MTPQQLKNSILQRAIEGRLVPQKAEEGTAKELLQKIQAEKAQLIAEKKIKKTKALPPIRDEEIPFDIPDSWEWVRLGNICDVCTGRLDANAQNPKGRYAFFTCGVEVFKTIEYAFDCDAILLGGNNASGDYKMHRYCGKFNAYQRVYVISGPPKDTLDFMYSVITYWLPFLKYNSQGTTTRFIKLGQVRQMLIPIPPFAEQKRIVAKIEEILPLIDKYDKAHTKLTEFNARFPEDMKKSILQYAIEGKLVEQRKEEGTADALLQQIQAEKKRLIEEKKIKKTKPLPPITDDEIPFDIPDSWKWIRLGEICTYDQTKEKISKENILSDMWSLDMEDIEKGTGRIINIEKAGNRKIAGDKVVFHKGDILYSKLRPYLQKILIAPADGICTSELVPFHCYGDVNSYYITWLLRSAYVNQIANAESYGVKMPRVNKETMINILVPLPPLAEQHRIVAKIEELLPLCEQLIK